MRFGILFSATVLFRNNGKDQAQHIKNSRLYVSLVLPACLAYICDLTCQSKGHTGRNECITLRYRVQLHMLNQTSSPFTRKRVLSEGSMRA